MPAALGEDGDWVSEHLVHREGLASMNEAKSLLHLEHRAIVRLDNWRYI